MQLSVVTADKAYDSEDNHVLVRDVLHAKGTWEIQETNEAWLLQIAVQSTKQE